MVLILGPVLPILNRYLFVQFVEEHVKVVKVKMDWPVEFADTSMILDSQYP